MKHYLFYIAHNYAFEILRPLQQEIRSRGDSIAWFVEGNEINPDYFHQDEKVLDTVKQAVDYNPRAILVPGNLVPDFIPGLKVQIFHGFEWKKKGHFRERGCFDLYCTQGPFFTSRFEQIRTTHPHFSVVETGWPKTDTLFNAPVYDWPNKRNVKTILYAPTFSPALTSASALFDEINKLAKTYKDWQWIIKFHPKMAENIVQQYQSISSDNLHVIETSELAPVLQTADVIVSDTSSIITEFGLLNKPIVTFKNKEPEAHLLNIFEPTDLFSAIEQALKADQSLLKKIKHNTSLMHPYFDGKSSARVLDAVEKTIQSPPLGLKAKPRNLFRKLKMRKKLGYWNF
ncbi:CDP-glycerol glycerophosphotransferase family protein [uncultured Paraglaciecola sp.]|uniref:CDP-glycerol glycerophosphotransferase family protein n=1 Tax=uncultured Paraglaciecola sp. TaxID=1765024 RepID=UPI0025F2E38E|nr:CDP-glycerol glycerophosphotransferase family protein [uncultured Paraglaciecola sp.]